MSSARKVRDFKESNSSIRRENDSLKLFEARAKMAEQESLASIEDRTNRVPCGEAGDKAELMAKYKVGKVEHWCPNEAIAVWEELEALVAAEGEVKPSGGDGVILSLINDDAQVDQAGASQARH
ncbi:hypothetical protein ACOSP7_002825 [Xanthoceras sorbifolium]